MASNITVLDRVLAQYGPEAKEVRDLIRRVVVHAQSDVARGQFPTCSVDPLSARANLSLKNRGPRAAEKLALDQGPGAQPCLNLAQTRWLMFEQEGGSIPMSFLVVLVF
jgi:hypothetical protein